MRASWFSVTGTEKQNVRADPGAVAGRCVSCTAYRTQHVRRFDSPCGTAYNGLRHKGDAACEAWHLQGNMESRLTL